MNYLGIIPARYASTRFPGKPLAKLDGKPVIQHVYEQASKAIDHVTVATDDERIYAAVLAFGGQAVMTSPNHRSGTDRCYEACQKIMKNENHSPSSTVIINIQGDEPFIQPEQIETLKECFQLENTRIATLVKPFEGDDTFDDLANQNSPKVVINNRSEALYFSRSIIPYLRGRDRRQWIEQHTYYKHIGLYGYRADTLRQITALAPSPLETAESLEQLRWLENGFRIRVGITHLQSIGIDTPEDLIRAEKEIRKPPASTPLSDRRGRAVKF